MSRFQKIFGFGFLLLLAGLIYMEANKAQPINWFPSYDARDKIPLGGFVFDELLKESIGDNLTEIKSPPFEKLKNTEMMGTYLFINDYFDFDKAEMNSMFQWIEKGNSVFISGNYLGENLLDSLHLKMQSSIIYDQIKTEPLLALVNEKFKYETPFHINKDFDTRYFSEIDTLSNIVLGISDIYTGTLKIETPEVNFIKIKMGKGELFLHAQPEIFSNFFLVDDDNSKHTSDVLSYINNGNHIYLDHYYKSGKHINISPLRVLLNNKYFKWAYYFMLIGILLFIVFEGKRKQKAIPIVAPLENKTYEYTRTIAGMYLDESQHHKIAGKQISLFLEYIRTQLRIPTDSINSRFFKSISEKSGNSEEDTMSLFTRIEKIQNQTYTTAEEVVELHTSISAYKNKNNGKH